MRQRIRKDLERYKRIVRGELRKELRKLIKQGSIVGQKGKDIVKVPIKGIQLPEFHYDLRSAGGIGSGDGELGQPIKLDDAAEGVGRPGIGPGVHYPEVEIEVEEIARLLGEELELPRIEPKDNAQITQESDDYRDISITGPETLLMKKRSYKKGLLRQLMMRDPEVEPGHPFSLRPPIEVTPIKEDKRYLYNEPEERPETKAVILFMRDASGSMAGEKTEIIRQENYWIDLWLRTNYDSIERVYILHDYEAQETNEERFYKLSTGGGTRISSAYKLANKIIATRYPLEAWNIYLFHFSDGENWVGDTESVCVPLLRDELIPKSNIFCYGQVTLGTRSPGIHVTKLREHLGEEENLLVSIIASREDILDSIKEFLGKGK
ncbi:MAG: DUF444 family protein [Candidatus Bipolaricaulia bacterium]